VVTSRRTIDQGGRQKAYRPMPEPERRAALEAGLAAYERGDYFLAHEILEPAWMGASDVAERELLQGLIKLAAAFVHGARSNAEGMVKNLGGARDRLAASGRAGERFHLDAPALVAEIDRRLAGSVESADPPVPIGRRPG
jgi:predicted metal-dependent hydrolase